MKFLSSAALLLLFVIAITPRAQAQNVPAAAEPSRVQKQLAPVTPAPSPASPPAVSSAVAVTAPEGAEKIKFTLKKIIIEDMTVYAPAQVEPLYAKLLGHEVTLADVFRVAAELTVKYRNDGYILTQVIIPPQTIDGGVVRLKVVEGYVDKVTVEGSTRGSRTYIQGFADKIKAAKPLTSQALERYMLLLNDLPGISARAVLSPAAKPGASDVTIIVSQKPYNLLFETDNRGSRYIGPLQMVSGAQVNNAFGLYEGISLQAAAAPDGWPRRELSYGSFNWMQPVGTEGLRFTVGGSVSSTHPGFTLDPFDVSGIARTATVQAQYPFWRSRNLSLTGSAKFDYLNSYRNDNLGLPPTVDHVRALRVGGTLQIADKLGGANTLNIEASQGLNVLNASSKGDANMTHPSAEPQFFKTTAEASRLQPITGPWSLFAAAAGQKSSDLLLASEQFGVGGIAFGSAYDASEITGDDGIAGRVELRADNLVKTPLSLLQFYGFYDIGQVWDPGNASADDRIRSVASTGLGARAALNENFSGVFEAARPLTRPVATTNDKETRFFGALTLRY